MKIQQVLLGEVQIPLTRPFTTALRSVTHVDDLVVKVVTDDGRCGYGEAPPTAVITGETKGSIAAAIRSGPRRMEYMRFFTYSQPVCCMYSVREHVV